jgi:hypothetical protein
MALCGIVCRLSPKRLDLLREEPDLLSEVILERHDTRIPGLVDLGKTWDALDVLLSDRGGDALLGDAVLGRTGLAFGPALGHGRPRLLSPDRVVEVARALQALDDDLVRARYPLLARKTIHGDYGQDADDDGGDGVDDDEEQREAAAEAREAEIEELTLRYRALREVYAEAAREKHSILLVVV